MSQCMATRPGLNDIPRRCKRRTWGGTDYCYQHAIANGDAIVITMERLRWAIDSDRDGDPHSASLARTLFRRLREFR
jgi:hypothetical protein